MREQLIFLLLALSLTGAMPTAAKADEAIAQKAGCLGCHAVGKKIVGPPYRDVAAKYRDNPFATSILSAKVRNGAGKRQPIPMPPHDQQKISDADLKTVIEWILKQ